MGLLGSAPAASSRHAEPAAGDPAYREGYQP